MEMRKESFKEIEQETIMSWMDFEDFIKGSIEGITVINHKGCEKNIEFEQIMNELNVNKVEEIYYIENLNAVKILFINGDYDVLYRK